MSGHQLLPVCCALLGILLAGQHACDAQEVIAGGKRDYIFLVDGTMGSPSIVYFREFLRRFVNARLIGPDASQVGVVTFGATPKLKMDLNSHGTKEALIAGLRAIKPRTGQTVNIGAALDFVWSDMLRPEKGSRIQQGVPQLLLLLTSRRSNDSAEVPAQALQKMGVMILAAGFRDADEEELRQLALADQLVFMYRDIRELLRNPIGIITALSTLVGESVVSAATETVEDFTPTQKPQTPQDIVFLLDGSDYVGSANFPHVRDFMVNMVSQLDVRPDGVQIGLLQFAERPSVGFHLNSYNNKQDLVNRTSDLKLMGGSVLNTGAALDYALLNMFQQASGSRRRQGVQQVLVLITGGPAQDQVQSVADKLSLAGVLTITVSSGQANESQLKAIAFATQLAFHRTDFSDLPDLAHVIVSLLMKH